MEAARSSLTPYVTRVTTAAAVALLMLVAAIQLWPRVSFWQQSQLAKSLVAELEQAKHPPIQIALKQISSLGNPAIEALILAAASERADIALAARQIIEEQIAAWQLQADAEGPEFLAEPTALLSAALARHVEKFGPFGQQWVTRLTLDIVSLAESFSVDVAVLVLADCSAVLSAVPAQGPRMLTPTEESQPSEPRGIARALPEVRVPPLLAEPSTIQPRSPLKLDVPFNEAADANDTAASELNSSTALPRVSSWSPEWSARPPLVPKLVEAIEGGITLPAPGELIDVPSPDEAAELLAAQRQRLTRDLLLQLQDTDPFTAAAIREVLAERGISQKELALAERLLADDAGERLALIDDLKVLPARSARRWLREMLTDTDAGVRLKALSALATTNDPELRAIVRDLAVHDRDPRVADLATQIMRQLK